MLKKMITVTVMLFAMCFISVDAFATTYYSFGSISIVRGSEVRIPCRIKNDDLGCTLLINSGLNGDCGVSFAIYECGSNLQVTDYIEVFTNGRYIIEYNRTQVVEGKKYYVVFQLGEHSNAERVVISGSWTP